MVHITDKQLTLEEFLALPDGDVTYELVNGVAIPKVSPKFFHSTVQRNLLFLLDSWCEDKGRVVPEWAITLKRHGKDWVPVPDLTYISFDRLPAEWVEDEACPVAPELAIEIISPGQTFGEMVEKAINYLEAGVQRVWVIDTQAKNLTVFYPDAPPQTYTGEMLLADSLFPGLQLTAQAILPSQK
ncbi:MAG: Uma2 family endonuclease [Oculatellaceae cyanobacterium bins.114]|nr:Uma2 family endonuclease [Oculatellaceae cyanobacterium bins.114]